MIRNFALIVGVSLSLAAFGCGSSDDNNSGGSGGAGGMAGSGGDAGAGGEGGAGGLPSDACTNDDDLAIVCDEGFSDAVDVCARGASGDPARTAECLVTDTSVSEACASCYGAVTGCILTNCLAECATAPDSQACTDCQTTSGCDALQADCTGDLETACSGAGGAG